MKLIDPIVALQGGNMAEVAGDAGKRGLERALVEERMAHGETRLLLEMAIKLIKAFEDEFLPHAQR